MEDRRKAVNATQAPNTIFLKKIITVVAMLLILTVLCTCISFAGFNVSSLAKQLASPHAYRKTTNKHLRYRLGLQNASMIERSALPRSSHLISAKDNPLSQYYTVWNEETPHSALNAKGGKKKILVWNPWPPIWMPRQACRSMPQCEFTKDRGEVADADAVIFWFRTIPPVYNKSYFPQSRPAQQYWIMRTPDCPYMTRIVDWVSYAGVFNWTMTYRNDSDVYMPWGHITSIYEEITRKPDTLGTHYPKQEGKLVIWYVSNCYKHLSRFAYANELMKYIKIDVFGGCGKEYCRKGDANCFSNQLQQYKFYLSFENFKCIEYITEKFWKNALRFNLVPIVLGAPRSDYERFAPSNSFIHIDDFKTPRALASYLLYLDQSKDKYMQYFAWKNNPPKNLPDFKKAWCELCKNLVHVKPNKRKVYNDIDKWWLGPNYEFCEPLVMVSGNIRNERLAVHYP